MIIDFGLSKLIEGDDDNTVVGTPMYQAPEILKNGLERKAHYGAKVDVYAFGLIMYSLIEQDFLQYVNENIGKSYKKFVNFIVNNNERPPFEHTKEPLRKLVEECWDADPKKRPSFETIFQKLAYGFDQSDSDIDLKSPTYFLDDVDQKEISEYVNSLVEYDSGTADLKNQVEIAKQELETLKQEMDQSISLLQSENEKIKNKIEEIIPKKITDNRKTIKRNFVFREFNGLLAYLVEKTVGNIHDGQIVKITTNSLHKDDVNFFWFKKNDFYHPKNLVEFKDVNKEYKSNDDGSANVCFDFKNRAIIISHYLIQSCKNPDNNANLRNWVLEVSNNAIDWVEIDKRENCSYFKNSHGEIRDFETEAVDFFSRYVRIRQTGQSFYNEGNRNIISFCNIEFFGEMKE